MLVINTSPALLRFRSLVQSFLLGETGECVLSSAVYNCIIHRHMALILGFDWLKVEADLLICVT